MRSIILLFVVVAVCTASFAQDVLSAPSDSVNTPAIKSDQSVHPALKLTRSLRKGMKGSDVQALQTYLKLIPTIYPDGSVTGYFGTMTEVAVKRLQVQEGLVSSATVGAEYGVVGPLTLAKINEIVMRGSPSQTTGSKNTELAKAASTTTPRLASPQSATSSSLVSTSTLPARDTAPPIRSRGSPGSTLPITTLQVQLSLFTDEPARCYWSTVPNTPFDAMTSSFSTTGGTTHVSTIPTLSTGDYAFYVKCRDQYMNANTSDYPILFSIEHRYSGRDTDPPRVSMSFPTNGDVITEGLVSLSAAAADNAGVSGVNFFLNAYDLNAEDITPPFSVTIMLAPGSYTAFAVARDTGGNLATSTTIAFSVTAKPSVPAQSTSLNLNPTATASVWPAVFQLFLKLLQH